MTDSEIKHITRHIADLRLQVNALEVIAKNGSLHSSVDSTRKTIRWSALIVAVALVASSGLKLCADSRVRVLEKRIEQLEKR